MADGSRSTSKRLLPAPERPRQIAGRTFAIAFAVMCVALVILLCVNQLRPIAIVFLLICLGAAGWLTALMARGVRHRQAVALALLIPTLLCVWLAWLPVPYLLGLDAPRPVFNRAAPVSGEDVTYYVTGLELGTNQPVVYGMALHWTAVTVVAVRASTGKQLWQRSLPLGRVLLASDATTMYLALGDPSGANTAVSAFDGSTGALRWQYALPGPPLSLCSAGSTIVARVGADILALRAADGQVTWRASAPPSATVRHDPASLVVSPDARTIYDRTDGPTLEARSVADGVKLWSITDLDRDGLGQLVAGGDALYEAPTSGALVALDATTGAVRWRFAGEAFQWGTATENTFYVTSRLPDPAASPTNPKVIDTTYALDAHSGTLRWTAPIFGRLAASPDAVYVRADTEALALRSSDGSLLWRHPAENQVFSPVAPVTGSVVYLAEIERLPPEKLSIFGSSSGQTYLSAVNGANGALYWSVPVGPVATLSPHIVF